MQSVRKHQTSVPNDSPGVVVRRALLCDGQIEVIPKFHGAHGHVTRLPTGRLQHGCLARKLGRQAELVFRSAEHERTRDASSSEAQSYL